VYKNKALLVYVDEDIVKSKVEEFKVLAEVANYNVIDIVIQRRSQDPRYYLGYGKLCEVKEYVRRQNIDVLITYHHLKPTQYFNLEKELKIRVIDRIQLILEIFDKRAGSKEAKLQIELAKLRYELPRIREYIRLVKLGEQIGFHGAGEYAVEAYYRHVRQRITSIKRELSKVHKRKASLIIKRRNYGIPEIVLTGYTMAGKTTIFNRLSREFKYRDGRPFATLDTYSRLIVLDGRKAIITDTVGFIDDLPPLLVESFYATIEEIRHSDLILLVLDVSDPDREFERKLRSSLKILNNLAIPSSKVLPILNKIDLVGPDELNEKISIVKKHMNTGDVVSISAEYGIGFNELKMMIINRLSNFIKLKLKIDPEKIPEWIYSIASVNFVDGSVVLSTHEQNLGKILNWINTQGLKVDI